MDYTSEQIEMLSKAWDKKAEKKKILADKRKEEALSRAYQIAEILKREFKVGKVYLFGSLAWRDKLTNYSDIDIYLVGFPADHSYWDALVRVERIAHPYPVNLVLSENACESLKNKVEKEGTIL